MSLSVLDMFSIGVGPSSSHTVGPMRAAREFVSDLRRLELFDTTARVWCGLFGSLGATGRGHGSDTAVMAGLGEHEPETIDPVLLQNPQPPFDWDVEITLLGRQQMPGHPNGMRFVAADASGHELHTAEFYSIGGGFIVRAEDLRKPPAETAEIHEPYPFNLAEELLEHCAATGKPIAQIALANELAARPEAAVREHLLAVWQVMQECVYNGCTRTEELLPGSLRVKRRAPQLYQQLLSNENHSRQSEQPTAERTPATYSSGQSRRTVIGEKKADPLTAMDWVSLYALAVNEENASGGRVVTAPTNGAAGIIPAVLHYYVRFLDDGTQTEERVIEFLLTAGAVGSLLKRNASISGAELGCQAEVGSACAMAAAGLCAVLGGSPQQVENAAEIGLEHNLGLTCDPVGGLVQVPCIERNAIASVKAITAARLALVGDGTHLVTLDQAIKTMRDTGLDMKRKYKETSLGGLAVNVVEC